MAVEETCVHKCKRIEQAESSFKPKGFKIMQAEPRDSTQEHIKGPLTMAKVNEGQPDVLRWIAGRSDEVAEGGRLVIDVGEKSVGIFRVDGKLYAYLNICVHRGGPICQGQMLPRVIEVIDETTKEQRGLAFDKSDPHIVCPWHGFEYSIKTGFHAVDHTIRLKSVPVEEEEGTVYVTV